MCKYLKILFLTIICIAVSATAEHLDLSEIESLLPKDSIVRATFVQIKEMQSLEKPLISTGKLLVVREKGVVWLMEAPTRMKKVIPLIEDEMSKSEHAMLAFFFNGTLSALEKRFYIELIKNEDSWLLVIMPKSSALKRRLKNITIKSSYHNKFQEVIILSADDNALKINFISEIPTPQFLSEDEERLFEE